MLLLSLISVEKSFIMKSPDDSDIPSVDAEIISCVLLLVEGLLFGDDTADNGLTLPPNANR